MPMCEHTCPILLRVQAALPGDEECRWDMQDADVEKHLPQECLHRRPSQNHLFGKICSLQSSTLHSGRKLKSPDLHPSHLGSRLQNAGPMQQAAAHTTTKSFQ